jgi:hypothetical protein
MKVHLRATPPEGALVAVVPEHEVRHVLTVVSMPLVRGRMAERSEGEIIDAHVIGWREWKANR